MMSRSPRILRVYSKIKTLLSYAILLYLLHLLIGLSNISKKYCASKDLTTRFVEIENVTYQTIKYLNKYIYIYIYLNIYI